MCPRGRPRGQGRPRGLHLCQWADTSRFFCTFFDIRDEDALAVIFMKPNDGCASDEDSANENDGYLIDNLAESQLNPPAEALLSDERPLKIFQIDRNNKSIDAEQIYK